MSDPVTQQVVILRTVYPAPSEDEPFSYDYEWLVQWSHLQGTGSKWFVTFEEVSRFVEGELIA